MEKLTIKSGKVFKQGYVLLYYDGFY